MRLLKKVKKLMHIKNGGEELAKWQERLRKNKAAYDGELAAMDRRDSLYNGFSGILGNGGRAKSSKYVRNIVSEIIEAEVDSSVPMPKVAAKRPGDERRASAIEAYLRNELDLLPFERINDMDERTTPIQGGDYFHVEWDNSRSTHSTLGGVRVTLLHPRQVIPQSGVTEINDMDYIFILSGVTKEYVKRTYGIDVSEESEEYPQARSNAGKTEALSEDMVTLVTAYYKNEDNGIGVYRWVGDTQVQSIGDYFARQLRRCRKCGEPSVLEQCPKCGSRSFEYTAEREMPLERTIEINGISYPVSKPIPAYKPSGYPIVLRRNISKNNSLLGGSDVDSIEDQQELIKKLGDKIQEKLLKGGSYVTMPKNVSVKKTDEELKIINVDSPAEAGMIQVLNIQPNISNDTTYMEVAYQAARDTIGITDSFQGRRDTTAQSGAAKRFAAAQSAGRLESKRVMKQAAYQEVFELMFKFMLAYADEPRPTNSRSPVGDVEYGIFDRYDFLERDDAGELYWNDDFLFSVDTAGMAQSREALWQAAKEAYQSGAFGDPRQTDTRILYWAAMEKYHYPNAGSICEMLKSRREANREV